MDKALFNGWRVWRKSFVLGEKKSILRGLIFRIHKIRGILDNEKDQIIQTLLMNFSKGNFKYTSKYSWWWGVLKKWVYLEYRFLFCPFLLWGGVSKQLKKKKTLQFFQNFKYILNMAPQNIFMGQANQRHIQAQPNFRVGRYELEPAKGIPGPSLLNQVELFYYFFIFYLFLTNS